MGNPLDHVNKLIAMQTQDIRAERDRFRADCAALRGLLRDCRFHYVAALEGLFQVLHAGVIGLIRSEHGADRSQEALNRLQTASEIIESAQQRIDAALERTKP